MKRPVVNSSQAGVKENGPREYRRGRASEIVRAPVSGVKTRNKFRMFKRRVRSTTYRTPIAAAPNPTRING
jgi:hypothetical protein